MPIKSDIASCLWPSDQWATFHELPKQCSNREVTEPSKKQVQKFIINFIITSDYIIILVHQNSTENLLPQVGILFLTIAQSAFSYTNY